MTGPARYVLWPCGTIDRKQVTATTMIIIGIGANLSHPEYGLPRRTCGAAIEALGDAGPDVVARSQWYESEPVVREGGAGPGDQPWYVNGAVQLGSQLSPADLLEVLLRVEEKFGRVRSIADAPRTIDLDILAFGDDVIETAELTVPHPRLHQRAFTLLPIRDLAPTWCHPRNGRSVAEMIADLGEDQGIRVQPDAAGFLGTEWKIEHA